MGLGLSKRECIRANSEARVASVAITEWTTGSESTGLFEICVKECNRFKTGDAGLDNVGRVARVARGRLGICLTSGRA